MVKDVQYAVRLLRAHPLFTVTAALSLAIGIGATTTVFTIANALLLKPPPGVPQPGTVVDIGRSQDGKGFDNNSYPNFLDVRARSTAFEDVYAFRTEPQAMSLSLPGRAGNAERIFGTTVSTNYFTALRVQPHLGRVFTPADGDHEGENALTVMSHRMWTRRFAANPDVVGSTILLNNHPFVVAGIAPEGFRGTTILGADLWVPMTMIAAASPRVGSGLLQSRASVFLLMGGRLKPGVSLDQARAELDLIGRALEREYPNDNRGRGLRAARNAPVPGDAAQLVAGFMAILIVIAGLVLAIACANLAGVLLARATARRREIAVRLAIGASRRQLLRQLITETLVLFVVGAALGLGLARVMTTVLLSLLPALPLPVDVSLPLDGVVLAASLVVTLLAAIVSGLVPALHASRADVVANLKADARPFVGRARLRHAFVIAQVALSLVLVVAAGLFLRALQRANTIDPGFDAHDVAVTSFDLSLAGYDAPRGRAFARELVAGVRALPGVESAATAAILPLGGAGFSLGGIAAAGTAGANGPEWSDADWNVVQPGYFQMMRMALAAGRDFTVDDRAGSEAVAIVNELTARRFWPGQSALGRELLMRAGRDQSRTLRVVGVARDFKYRSLDDRPRLFVFVPLEQQYVPRLAILTRTPAYERVQSDIRSLVARMDRNLPIIAAQSFENHAALQLVPQRVAASVSGSLGLVGLLLAAIGIYGVTAYMVTTRTREMGIRMALGASPRDVVRMVLREGMMLASAGIVIGLLLAGAGSVALESLLFGVGPADPLAFAAAAVLFGAIGLTACYVPARRATAIHPTDALRYE